jgi:hypothetical protein
MHALHACPDALPANIPRLHITTQNTTVQATILGM